MSDTISQREKDILQIAKSISELAEIFRDINTLVIEQVSGGCGEWRRRAESGGVVRRVEASCGEWRRRAESGGVVRRVEASCGE